MFLLIKWKVQFFKISSFLYRWHSWAVLRSAEAVWVRRLPSGGKLFVLRWLRGQRQAKLGNNMPSTSLQDQIPWELLLAERKPWMCLHQPYLRVLRRVQAQVQRQALESVHRLLQLSPRSGLDRRQDTVHARWDFPGADKFGPDQEHPTADGYSGLRFGVWFTVVGSEWGRERLGDEWSWRFLHFWSWHCCRVSAEKRHGPHLSCPPGFSLFSHSSC